MLISNKKSFTFVIVISILVTIYFCFIAADRYSSGAGFAIRQLNDTSQNDMIGSVTGLPSIGSTTSDSYIIIKFLNSRSLLEKIENHFDFREIFSRPDIDIFSRMGKNYKIEQVLAYWRKKCKSSYDPSSGIIQFNVVTFSPKHSYELAKFIHEEVGILANKLSENARLDSLKFANDEVKIAEKNLLKARLDIMEFRSAYNAVDLSALSMAQIDLLSHLEKNLSSTLTRIEVLKDTLDSDAPSIKALESKARALETEINNKSGGLKITGYDEKLTAVLSQQEVLESKKKFAESMYTSALKFLERARKESAKNQKYLATFNEPSIPEHPSNSKRLVYSVFCFISFSFLWLIFIMIYNSIIDQIQSGVVYSKNGNNKKSKFGNKLKKLLKNPYMFFSDSRFKTFRILKYVFKNRDY